MDWNFPIVNVGSWFENVASSFAIVGNLNINADSLFAKVDS